MNKEENQPTRRSPASVLNDMRSAIDEIKKITSTPQPTLVSLSHILNKAKMGTSFIPALVDMKILESVKPATIGLKVRGGTRAYRWLYGAQDINIDEVYRVYCVKETIRKKGGTNKGNTGDDVVHHNKVVTPHNQMPKKPGEQKWVKPIDEKKDAFKDKGTIFGYKQLQFLKQLFLEKDSEVLIDDRMTIENVKLIKFSVDKSELTIEFFMFTDNNQEAQTTSRILAAKYNNIVLGFKNGFADSKTGTLKIYTVPVKNPYDIEV